MYQSNKQINEAFLAIIQTLEKIPLNWKLKDIREQNLFFGKNINTKKNNCHCNDSEDELNLLPYIFPIFPSKGDVCFGEFLSLPFYYLILMNKSKAFPLVEVIEIPLFENKIVLESEEKETIDFKLKELGISFIASQKKITRENLKIELPNIRRGVFSKIMNLQKTDPAIVFSAFTNIPEQLVLMDKTGYFEAAKQEEENTLWSFQSHRIIPLKYLNEFYTFNMNSWVCTKQEILL